jgi:ABC-2 type transport system ATP-binding protein
MKPILRSLPVALAALLLLTPAARAADQTVTSFDGTALTVHWFPQPGGAPAPTILLGHGWGGSGDIDESPGKPIARFRDAGYNVLTWDARGFGTSGGTVEVDSKDFEGRDVQALLDWLATRPEAQLDAPGDPRAGMAGGSYGGGIQLVTAGIDKRVDAITPQIAWHSLATSLYQDSIVKLGWAGLLYLSAAQKQLDPHIRSAYEQGRTTGSLDAESRRWFLARGPGALVDRITAPTLLVQGTVDGLFPLDEAVANYRILRKNNVPTKMLWYCGGHGVCLNGHADSARADAAVLAWLNKYVKRDAGVDTGSRFEGVDQRGDVFTAPDYPVALAKSLTAKGAGTLKLKASGGAGPTTKASGPIAGVTPAPARNAVNVALRTGRRGDRIVGAPRLTLNYRGTTGKGTRPQRVFAQLVDTRTGLVVGNQITPIPVRLDGKRRTVTRPLELVAQTLGAKGGLKLQLVATTPAYARPQLGGKVSFSAIALKLPVARR